MSEPVARFLGLVVDCRDPARMADFWCRMLGGEVEPANLSDDWVGLKDVPVLGYVGFQRVPEDKVVKNRVHIDVRVDDFGPAVASAVDLGAVRVGEPVEEPGNWFQVMRDIEGNEFCFIVLKPR